MLQECCKWQLILCTKKCFGLGTWMHFWRCHQSGAHTMVQINDLNLRRRGKSNKVCLFALMPWVHIILQTIVSWLCARGGSGLGICGLEYFVGSATSVVRSRQQFPAAPDPPPLQMEQSGIKTWKQKTFTFWGTKKTLVLLQKEGWLMPMVLPQPLQEQILDTNKDMMGCTSTCPNVLACAGLASRPW